MSNGTLAVALEALAWADGHLNSELIKRAISHVQGALVSDSITVNRTEWEATRHDLYKLAAQMAMKQSMPDVEHVVHSVNIPKKSWRSIQKMCIKSTQQCNDWSYELRKCIDRINAALLSTDESKENANS